MKVTTSKTNVLYVSHYSHFKKEVNYGFCILTDLVETSLLICFMHNLISFLVNSESVESMKLNVNIGKKRLIIRHSLKLILHSLH